MQIQKKGRRQGALRKKEDKKQKIIISQLSWNWHKLTKNGRLGWDGG